MFEAVGNFSQLGETVVSESDVSVVIESPLSGRLSAGRQKCQLTRLFAQRCCQANAMPLKGKKESRKGSKSTFSFYSMTGNDQIFCCWLWLQTTLRADVWFATKSRCPNFNEALTPNSQQKMNPTSCSSLLCFNERKSFFRFRQELLDFSRLLRPVESSTPVLESTSAGRTFQNRSLDVLRRQSTGENNRPIGKFH